ncbi:hypothetical protein AK812_SmicGene18784 [Symbiodinium microadriaticum]|uniref:Uncharacterized protein n=1 Tax=Symbiodinium microadriaticum TaxID=2951 RepID=A0A1Q9DUF5_SYMMI|nr:hypothetical protein AK812_SmicGene18784 [Symbiodinium microadriaticum]
MSGLDFAFVATDGSKQLALRMNFTSVPTQIQQHVNKQQDNSSPMTTTDVQLLVPVQGIRSPSPLAEFLDRQVGALSVRSVFAPALLEKDRDMQKLDDPSAVTFHEGDMYITDRGNHRVLKVRPGKLGGEVFFGGDGTGHLPGPSDVTFFEGNAYIVEKPRHRILKVKLGASHGETFFGGNQSAWSSLTSLLYPQRISFYGGKAYIVDTQNARILKVTPGEKKAELFFGQKWSGDTLAQLNTPASITFFQGSAYIADAMNSRILKLAPFMREAEVFFEGAGSDVTFFDGGAYVANAGMGNRILKVRPTGTEIFYGDRALLLHSSWLRSLKMHEGHAYIVDEGAFLELLDGACLRDVTFHKGSMYIVDPGLEPGQEEAAVFFGEETEKKGSSLHQLHRPSSALVLELGITFFGDAAYIVDSGNHRILKLTPGHGSSLEQLNDPSSITFYRGYAYIVDRGNHRVLEVKPGDTGGYIFFGGRGVGSSLHQLNRPRSIAFLESNAYIFDEGNRRVLVAQQSRRILGGGSSTFLPQLGHLVDLAFFHKSAFVLDSGSAVSKLSLQRRMLYLENCRMPLPAGFDKVANMDKVILRVQTAELGLRISPSMPTAEVAFLLLLVALPSFVAHASNDRTFHIICFFTIPVRYIFAPGHRGWVLWPWAPVPVFIAASFGELTATAFTEKEQKLSCSNGVSWELHLFTALLLCPSFKDLTSFLVMKACGYEYSWLPLIFLLAALIMQNVGGLLYASFALIWAVMMPPWKLVDLDLEAVGNFGTAVRLLVQDFPQLAVKLHFTFSFYASWFVVSDCAITLCVAAIDLLALARAGYRPTYHQLLLPHETSRAMTRGDGPETP